LVKDTATINKIFSLPDVIDMRPSTMKLLWQSKPDAGKNGKPFLMLYALRTTRDGEAQLGGEEVASAYKDIDERGRYSVTMAMKPEGARIWRKLTGANIGKQIAIVLDNRVQSAPVVQGEIPNGSSSISGNFTLEESSDLENILKAGKMPVPIRIVEESVVGPTLGAESIQQGLISILVGFLVIILFMVAYYSTSGFVADIAVLINVVLILGALVQFNAVLTLPGIAGIVLTIGMAVDANVLINERVREELRAGVPLGQAIDNGYKMASSSIWDANITHLIAGSVLVYFGSGPVQGFAATLILGIITSLFTSIYVTRLLNEWRLSKGQTIKFSTAISENAFKNINFDFVGKRKIAYIASSVLIIAGLAFVAVRGLNYGVDFSGGWSYIVQFEKDVTTDEVRESLAASLGGAPEVKAFGEAARVKITTNYLIADQSEDAAVKVETALKAGLAKMNAKYEIKSSAKVGPTVAQDIKSKSLLAVTIALIGIFGYIWFRFRRWEYALGATIAIFHDALVVIVFYTVGKDLLPFSLEVDQNFIAAVLTIVGYSVNDTVVIFDRIREMLKDEGPDVDRADLLNRALNNTFSRTVVTASTVFLVVLILLIFGGETVRGMSFALLIGVLSGTYSTIYIAVPFVLDAWKQNKDKAIV
jgi:SecD/SecF fusion protein